MALKAIKGITVEIGGDTVGLQKALNEVDKSSKILNSELRQVNNALKFDPANTTLLAQKQQILSEQIRNTSLKLQQLKSVQEQVEQKYKKGDIGADAYRAFQRVLIETENRLESMKNEQEELNEVTEETEEETEEAEKKTKNYGKALEGLVNAAANAGQAILDVAKAAGEMAIKGIQASTEVGKSFESSVSQIAATMGKTTDEISDLTEKAKEMGATTQFSATEAAQGLNILAMSGLKTEEQIAGIEKVLNLAAAGGLTLESAASYTTGTVKGFGDTMENAQYYTDLMAKGATLANTNVNDLGAALSRTAANANSYGQTADGVTLSLLRLAEQNITGENAATQLNRAMADLYTPTDTAKQALQELGIAAYDSQGNTRDFNVVVDELNAKLSTMTDEQANAYKNTIFTTNGLNAFNKMTASSTEKVELFKEELAKASEGEGSAAEQAKTMIDNLEGDITIMQSAAEGLGITFYETFNKDLRENVQFATDSLGQLTEAFKNGGIEEAADVAGGILADIANKAAEYAPQLISVVTTLINSVANALTENAPNIAQSAGEIVKSLAGGFVSNSETILNAVITIGESVMNELPSVLALLTARAGQFAAAIVNFLSAGIQLAARNIPRVLQSLSVAALEVLPLLTQSIFDLITNTVSSVLELIPEILPTVVELVTTLIELLLPDIINTVVTLAESIAENLPEILNVIITVLPDLIQGLLSAVLGQIPTLLQGVFAIVNAIVAALPEILVILTQIIPDIITAVVTAVTDNLPIIIQTGVTLFTSLISNLPKAITAIVSKLPEIINSIVSALIDNISEIVNCGVDLFLALIEALPEIIFAIQDSMPDIIAGIVTAVVKLFPVIVDLGKDLFMSLVGDLANTVIKIANRMPEIITSIVNKITEQFWKMVDVGFNLVSGIWEGITNAKDWLIDNIFGWCTSITDNIMNFFGIHSPSTLFRDTIGENLALGIGVGFSDTMTDVTKNMQNALPTSFDIDPDVNITSGDVRMQTLPQSTSILSAVQSGMGAVNFTLNIENFNNADSSALINLSDTITYTLYELIYRQKAVTA
ncbi:MAG: phage tail tape measure protein [Acutalibacteraceae bacterium]|nr:phage tail tape measure protein [Acutalibacteraceae bacterium]